MIAFSDILKAAYYSSLLDKHAAEGSLLEMPMPNGKVLRECTCREVGEMGEWFLAMQAEIDRLKAA